MSVLTRASFAALILAAAVAGVVLLMGPERFWALFAPADLGPVRFETLQRRATPNDALACPPGFCAATADIATPAYDVPPAALTAALVRALAGEPRLTQVSAEEGGLHLRYVQRSALLGYPDTIVVQVLALPGGASSLALYSRSAIGKGDMGVNRARLLRWLSLLAAQVPPRA